MVRLDTALWDIIAQDQKTKPFTRSSPWGSRDSAAHVCTSGGVEYAWYKRPEDLIDEGLRYKEQGYTAFKFRIGTEWKNSGITVVKYIPWVRRLREAVGPKFDLMQEGNMRWAVDELSNCAPVLEELKILWLEEPVPHNQRRDRAVFERSTNTALRLECPAANNWEHR